MILTTHARTADPQSSVIAALENAQHRKAQVLDVVNALKLFNGSTSAELAQKSGLDLYMVARRLPNAERRGLVYRCGTRKCEVSGKYTVTWFVDDCEVAA